VRRAQLSPDQCLDTGFAVPLPLFHLFPQAGSPVRLPNTLFTAPHHTPATARKQAGNYRRTPTWPACEPAVAPPARPAVAKRRWTRDGCESASTHTAWPPPSYARNRPEAVRDSAATARPACGQSGGVRRVIVTRRPASSLAPWSAWQPLTHLRSADRRPLLACGQSRRFSCVRLWLDGLTSLSWLAMFAPRRSSAVPLFPSGP
jgi:hypothetical protein